jgi:transposase
LRKLSENVTRTLESVPRQWKVVETIREKFSCRDCEKISQAPAPFHAVARGWAGPSLLAMIMFEKFGQHQPLNRQAERYALEGVPIALLTMADATDARSGKHLVAKAARASRFFAYDALWNFTIVLGSTTCV